MGTFSVEHYTAHDDHYLDTWAFSDTEDDFKNFVRDRVARTQIEKLKDLSVNAGSIYVSDVRCLGQVVTDLTSVLARVQPGPDHNLLERLWAIDGNAEIALHNAKLVLERANVPFEPEDLEQVSNDYSIIRRNWTDLPTADCKQ